MRTATSYEEIAVYLDEQGEHQMAGTLRLLIEHERAARHQSRLNLDLYYEEKAKHEPPRYATRDHRSPWE